MIVEPKPLHVHKVGGVQPLSDEDLAYDDVLLDPRGLAWMWEPPDPRANYVMGVDPTLGITNWTRHTRVTDDRRTDNGCIQIIRVGVGEPGSPDFIPDRQVCEYAAPIDPEELANVANVIGRLYHGRDEDLQCLCIIEVWPGPGLLTLRRMIEPHGYTNHFVWKTAWDAAVVRRTKGLGWTASPKSVRDLWIRTRRHILRGGLVHCSPWLVEEWTDCEMDYVKQTGQSIGGHDDRVRAVNLALWAAHEWSFEVETVVHETGEGPKRPEWQASDVSLEEMTRQWEEKFEEITG